jgi:hypothetical protein
MFFDDLLVVVVWLLSKRGLEQRSTAFMPHSDMGVLPFHSKTQRFINIGILPFHFALSKSKQAPKRFVYLFFFFSLLSLFFHGRIFSPIFSLKSKK